MHDSQRLTTEYDCIVGQMTKINTCVMWFFHLDNAHIQRASAFWSKRNERTMQTFRNSNIVAYTIVWYSILCTALTNTTLLQSTSNIESNLFCIYLLKYFIKNSMLGSLWTFNICRFKSRVNIQWILKGRLKVPTWASLVIESASSNITIL